MPRQVYKNKAGKRVVGVTTYLNELAKPALVKWANKLGLQGIDSSKYVDNLADIGILAHAMIMSHLRGEPFDYTDYTEEQVALAKNCFKSYLEWESAHTVTPISVEVSLVSEEYQFGGTPDLLAYVDGVITLIDFKTGTAIHSEYSIQVAAYWVLLLERGYVIDKAMILRIDRDGEGFEIKEVKALRTYWELFTHCQAIYELKKQARKEEK